MNARALPSSAVWRPLPDDAWHPTIRSLHRWAQIIGKIRLATAAPLPHWWHVPLYVTARGLTTSPIPVGSGVAELELDLHDHVLLLRRSNGFECSLPLRPMPVSEFYSELVDLLTAASLSIPIRAVPVEVVDAIPFADDTAPGGYVPEHARALHAALVNAHRVLSRFQSGFVGKASPVHFFWGSFDLAATRFSGRRAPRHPGGIPNCPDWVMVEAYSHELLSAGWWPGTDPFGAAFYVYMYPEPDGFSDASLGAVPGSYDPALREFVLPYHQVSQCDDPESAVLSFLEATYAVGAKLAGWGRKTLDRPMMRAG